MQRIRRWDYRRILALPRTRKRRFLPEWLISMTYYRMDVRSSQGKHLALPIAHSRARFNLRVLQSSICLSTMRTYITGMPNTATVMWQHPF